MSELDRAEQTLRDMLADAHGLAQHYSAHAATMVRQLEDEIRVEQARIADIRKRTEGGERDAEAAEEYADALERIADLNGALQQARRSQDRAKQFMGAEPSE